MLGTRLATLVLLTPLFVGCVHTDDRRFYRSQHLIRHASAGVIRSGPIVPPGSWIPEARALATRVAPPGETFGATVMPYSAGLGLAHGTSIGEFALAVDRAVASRRPTLKPVDRPADAPPLRGATRWPARLALSMRSVIGGRADQGVFFGAGLALSVGPRHGYARVDLDDPPADEPETKESERVSDPIEPEVALQFGGAYRAGGRVRFTAGLNVLLTRSYPRSQSYAGGSSNGGDVLAARAFSETDAGVGLFSSVALRVLWTEIVFQVGGGVRRLDRPHMSAQLAIRPAL